MNLQNRGLPWGHHADSARRTHGHGGGGSGAGAPGRDTRAGTGIKDVATRVDPRGLPAPAPPRPPLPTHHESPNRRRRVPLPTPLTGERGGGAQTLVADIDETCKNCRIISAATVEPRLVRYKRRHGRNALVDCAHGNTRVLGALASTGRGWVLAAGLRVFDSVDDLLKQDDAGHTPIYHAVRSKSLQVPTPRPHPAAPLLVYPPIARRAHPAYPTAPLLVYPHVHPTADREAGEGAPA